MIRAAGILFIDPTGAALFVKRGPNGSNPGEWAFPGGKIEDGETAEQAAARECVEEIGFLPDGTRALWTRRIANAEIGASQVPTAGLPPTDALVMPGEQVDFTTFLQRVPERFEPTLNDEHTGYAWALPSDPPEPLHPGARVALDRLTMDELGVARAMVAGDLTSPQRYGGFLLWKIRITGTGLAWRGAVKDEKTGKVIREEEFCWRDKSIYLTPDFLARCAGLPVTLIHSKGKTDSEEWGRRSVGTVFLPFVEDEEVWSISKVYDEDANAILLSEQFSTSPAVFFPPGESGQKLKTEDGTNLFIEGKPALLDSISLVPQGVWDKGGGPVGVQNDLINTMPTTSQQEPIGMTDEEKAVADKARKDAETKLDAILNGLQRMDSRMDAFEAAEKDRKDAEEVAEKDRKDSERRDSARKDRFDARKDGESDDDFKGRFDADEKAMCDSLRKDGDDEDTAAKFAKDARKDAEEADEKGRADRSRKDAEQEKEKERMGAARHDAVTQENADLKARLAAMEATIKGITTETPASERDALAAAQSRADSVAAMFGDRASAPIPGETPLAYRKRLLSRFQRHSTPFKETRLDSYDDATLGVVEDRVYADSVAAARAPGSSAPGQLIEFTERDRAGRTITKYHGDIMAWMTPFMTGATVGKINRNPKAN